MSGVALSTLTVGCSSDEPVSLSEALVVADDLPGEWGFYERSAPVETDVDLCGRPRDRPRPAFSAATAWAVSPDDGPILGQRLERFDDAADVVAIAGYPLELPCIFTRPDGTRWKTEQLEPVGVGDDSRVYLVTSLDRPDSLNYQVVIAAGDVAVLAVLNVREPDRAFLDELVEIVWSKAERAGAVG